MATLSFILVVFAFVLVAVEAYRTRSLGWSGLAFWLLALILAGVRSLNPHP